MRPNTPTAALRIALIAALTPAPLLAQDDPEMEKPTLGSKTVLDERFRELIPESAELTILASGFEWSEGPLWVPEGDGFLIFSDIPRNTVFMWTEGAGIQRFLRPSGYTGEAAFTGREPGSNGLVLDPRGRIVLCQHGDRRVVRLKDDGSFRTLASEYEGKRLNSPNDAVFKSDGSLYFTDPPYGLPENVDDPAKELDFQGVYRLDPDGTLTLLTKELSRPNGIAFSPDEGTLYVANSDPERPIWMAFPVGDDGTLGDGSVFFDAGHLTGDAKGLPDGMAVDRDGNLFATGPGGVLVLTPDGTHLGTLVTGEATANCTFGGPDRSTLFVTADMHLCRIETNTKGPGN